MQELQIAAMALGWASVAFGVPATLGTLYYSVRNAYRAIVQFESFRR